MLWSDEAATTVPHFTPSYRANRVVRVLLMLLGFSTLSLLFVYVLLAFLLAGVR